MSKTKKTSSEVAEIAESPFVPAESVTSALEIASEMDLGCFDVPQIKVPSADAGVWSVLGEGGAKQHVEAFEGIILAMNAKERSWWAVDYDARGAGDSPRPQCHSMDGKTGHGIREVMADDDVEPSSMACAECPWSQWGSDRKSGVGQDCKQIGVAAVLLPGQSLPHILRIPPSSADAIRTFVVDLLSSGKKMTEVVTRFSLVPDKSSTGKDYCRVVLEVARTTTPEEAELVVSAKDPAKDLLLRRADCVVSLRRQSVLGRVSCRGSPL